MRQPRLNRLPWPILLGLAFGVALTGYIKARDSGTITVPVDLPNIPITEAPPSSGASPSPTITIPTSHTIANVPFTPQAPFANWDELHNEACEEASVLMVRRYFAGERGGKIDPGNADQEIFDIVEWEKANLGKYLDTNTDETNRILTEKYGLKSKVTTTVSANSIKKEIAAGHLVIVPAAGQQLPNPYFRSPGPPYHMVVIVGYDHDEFITNDPGTRRGEGFKYKHADLVNAVHDWNGSTTNITQGRKAMIVIEG